MITQIKAEGFRGKLLNLVFHQGVNKLLGRNESGKSAVKEALAFVWSGTDSLGTRSPDHLITVGTDRMEVSIGTEKSVITRRKKRGETSDIRLVRDGIPDIKPNQTEFQTMLGFKGDTFTSLWLSGFFMSLSTAKKLEVLGDLVKLDRRAILQELLGEVPVPTKLKLVNPKTEADQIAVERRALQNIVSSEEGQLTALNQEIVSIAPPAELDEAALTTKMNEVSAKLIEFDMYHKLVANYNERVRTYQQNLKEQEQASARVADANAELSVLTPKIAAAEERVKQLEDTGKTLVGELNMTRALMKPRLTFTAVRPDYTAVGSTCSTCKQPVTKEHYDSQLEVYNTALVAFNEAERAIADHNKGVESTVAALEKRLAVSREAYSTAKQDLMACTNLSVTLKNTVARYSEILSKQLVAPNAPEVPQGDEAALRAEAVDAAASFKTYKHVKARLTLVQQQIENLTEACNKKRVQVLDLSKLETCLRQLPEVEVGRVVDSLQANGVAVGMEDGELWFADQQGIRYQSLSTGRQMKADLALLEKLRSLAGNKAPSWVYVDNIDLIDNIDPWLPQGVQVIVAEVVGCDLQVM